MIGFCKDLALVTDLMIVSASFFLVFVDENCPPLVACGRFNCPCYVDIVGLLQRACGNWLVL